METLFHIIVLCLGLLCSVAVTVIAFTIHRLAGSFRNSERILRRLLEIIKESSNEAKAAHRQVF